MTDSPDASLQVPARRGRSRWWAALLGAGLAVLVVAVGWRWLGPERLPEVDSTRIDAARKRWRQHEPSSYAIEVTVQGPQPGVYHTVVRDGSVQSATFNDQPLSNPRTLGTWSVPGMFRTISYDLNSQEAADPQRPRLLLRARFDPEYGYPAQYQRIEFGTYNQLTWQVTRFEVIKHE